MNTAKFETTGSEVPDNLYAGEFPRQTETVTIASGAGVLTRGTVLGKITTGGQFVKSLSAEDDGSQTPEAILAQDVDATSATKEAAVYLTGCFNASELTLGADHTVASIKQGLRDKGIFLK